MTSFDEFELGELHREGRVQNGKDPRLVEVFNGSRGISSKFRFLTSIKAGVMLPPHSTRPTSTASSSRWGDLLARHRQPTDIGNGFDRAVWPDPVGHDDGEQQQTDRDRERQRPTAGAVEDPSEGDR